MFHIQAKKKAAKFSPKGHPLPRAAEGWVRGSLLAADL